MPRFRNTRTGSVVNVDDATAARLGAEYQPLDKPAPAKPAAPRKPRGKSTKKQQGGGQGEPVH